MSSVPPPFLLTQEQFFRDWPEFEGSGASTKINMYLRVATLMINVPPFDAETSVYAAGLFVAHHLALDLQAMNAAKRGAVPGLNTGPVSSKSVGPVSISYATGDVLEVDAGHWNLTSYGTRFLRLAKMFGMGPAMVLDIDPPGGWMGSEFPL